MTEAEETRLFSLIIREQPMTFAQAVLLELWTVLRFVQELNFIFAPT